MAGIHGIEFYGRVDAVPGLFHVATKFFHFNFIPIFPTETYIISDVSTIKSGYLGGKIPFSLKSILVGYFRGWVGAASAILFAMGLGFAGESVLPAYGLIMGLILGFGLAVIAVQTSHQIWIIAWVSLVGFSIAFWTWDSQRDPKAKAPAAAKAKQELKYAGELLLAANACLLSVSMMRVFDRATRSRAYQLAAMMGLPPEAVDVALDGAFTPDRDEAETKYEIDS